jgi:hypothetical protein
MSVSTLTTTTFYYGRSGKRLLSHGRIVPNELDIENVAEEIESVGWSELAAVRSYLL